MKWVEVGSGPYPLRIKDAEIIHTDIKKHHGIEILCDAHSLPFRNEMFDGAYASHVLEHVNNPIKVIQELKRVVKRLVVLRVPNATYNRFVGEPQAHIYGWNEFTIKNLLERFFKKVEIQTSTRTRSTGKLRKRIELVKILLISLFVKESNELTVICYK